MSEISKCDACNGVGFTGEHNSINRVKFNVCNFCNGKGYLTEDDMKVSVEWLHEMPKGWRLAFGEKMLDELNDMIIRHKATRYQVLQVKEKFGELRWYDSGVPKSMEQEHNVWLDNYAIQSLMTCEICGERGVMCRRGSWWTVLCDEHRAIDQIRKLNK